MGDIFTVAAPYITRLFNNDHFDFFRLDIPAGAELADHVTGPRILIILTELSGQRLADQTEFHVPANHVMYLDNEFSLGFRNTGGVLSYLVISLHNQSLKEPATHPQNVQTKLATNLVTVDYYDENQRVFMPQSGLLYRNSNQQVLTFDAGQKVPVEDADWVVLLAPELAGEG